MKFRKKPIVIEAAQVSVLLECARNNWKGLPIWISAAYDRGDVRFLSTSLSIHTLEGVMIAEYDDFLIQGIQGELYPCKPDIFQASYEPVNTEEKK